MICSSFRTTVILLTGICLLTPCYLAAQAITTASSELQGTVFSGEPDEPLYAAGAKVTLYGDTGIVSTVTDQDGKFIFSNIAPPGIYFLQVIYLGLHAERNVTVDTGCVVQVSLRLEARAPETPFREPTAQLSIVRANLRARNVED